MHLAMWLPGGGGRKNRLGAPPQLLQLLPPGSDLPPAAVTYVMKCFYLCD